MGDSLIEEETEDENARLQKEHLAEEEVLQKQEEEEEEIRLQSLCEAYALLTIGLKPTRFYFTQKEKVRIGMFHTVK